MEMGTPKQMIEAKLKSSDFVLTFETDETVGYRCGPKGEVSRTICVHLKQRTVEYELAKRGMLNGRRIEHFETIEQLLEYIPASASSFDLKLQGLKLEADGAAVETATRPDATAPTEDPWDLTNYCARPRRENPHSPTGLRLANVDLP